MNKLAIGISALALSTSFAFAEPTTFTFTVTSGGLGTPITGVHVLKDSNTTCPDGKVKLVPASNNAGVRAGVAPPMTAEQRIRGDKRFHVVCDRSAKTAE